MSSEQRWIMFSDNRPETTHRSVFALNNQHSRTCIFSFICSGSNDIDKLFFFHCSHYCCDHGESTESQRGCKNRRNKIEWPYWCRAECVISRTDVFSGSPDVSTLYHMWWTFSSTLYATLEHLQVQMSIVSFVLQRRIYGVFKRHRSIQSQSQSSMCTCIVLQQASFLEIDKSSYLVCFLLSFPHIFSLKIYES